MKKIRTVLYRLFIRRLLLKIFILGGVLFTLILWSNWYIVNSTRDQIYHNVDEVPEKRVALVLGTSRYSYGNAENPYFVYRMEAAASLYLNGKVQHILVSGDNHIESYNEPEDMLNKLVELGAPAGSVTLDFAGFRTFDSVIRAKEIFETDDIIIVSQEYHLQRALYIANQHGIKAVGFTAKGVNYKGINLREKLAKFKAVLDCTILFTSPKFLGEKEPISLN